MELKQPRRKSAELELENQRMKEDLRASDQRFFEIFHASANPMAITTIKEARVIDPNEATASFSGFERQELLGRTFKEVQLWLDPKDWETVLAQLQREGNIHNMNVKLTTKGGGPRTALFSANLITVNSEPCCLSTLADITARERETYALRQSEQKC